MKIKIVFISDTHTYLGNILDRIPEADILVHCGDALSRGSIQEFGRFARTLGNIHKKFNNILITPGNHDICVERETNVCRMILKENAPNALMLIDEEFVYNGLKFYGSPWTPEFFNWSFMYNRERGKEIWDRIPEDVDILFTHGMPYRVMDEVEVLIGGEVDPHVGCKDLRERIREIKPTIYAGGHLHFNQGKIMQEHDTLFMNVAICDEDYIPKGIPKVIEIDSETKEWRIIQ